MDIMHANLGSFASSEDGMANGFGYAMMNEQSTRRALGLNNDGSIPLDIHAPTSHEPSPVLTAVIAATIILGALVIIFI